MSLAVLKDFEDSPTAFSWAGPIPQEALKRWLAQKANWPIPGDLITLWGTVGGGDLFEGETILGPFSPRPADDIDDFNESLRRRGMPSTLLAFHVGMCISAIDQVSGLLVQLDPEFLSRQASFSTFESWYRNLIRKEYAERYELKS